jgi:GTP-binding protein HflX
MAPIQVKIPFDRTDLVEIFHRRGRVEHEQQDEEGTLLCGALPRPLFAMFGRYRYPATPRRRQPVSGPAGSAAGD